MIKTDGQTIRLPIGDTGTLTVSLGGAEFAAGDVAILFVKDMQTGTEILKKTVGIEDGAAIFEFANADTEDLTPGSYVYDVRVVMTPSYDETDETLVTGGAQVHSLYAAGRLPQFVLTEVAGDV